jgi:hypothetical protein
MADRTYNQKGGTEMRIFVSLLCLGLLLVGMSAYAATPTTLVPPAGPPRIINFQGKLTTPLGVPVSGNYTIIFRLWTLPTGGSLWHAETLAVVVDTDGLYNVEMSMPDSMVFDTPIWLGVQVESNAEMVPRYRFTTAPYAFWAMNAGMLGGRDASEFVVGDGITNFIPKWITPDSLGISTISESLGNTVYINNDVVVAGQARFGPGSTNPGVYAFAAGENANAIGNYSTVGGGYGNTAADTFSVIGGGAHNFIGLPPSVDLNTSGAEYSAILGGYADTIYGDYSYLFGIQSVLNQDSTFMVDMPHIRFGDEATGYEFPTADGDSLQYMITDGNGQLSWTSEIPACLWNVVDSVIYTDLYWGIARGNAENMLWGESTYSHVNLGSACTTGTDTNNALAVTIAGGRRNLATNDYGTIGGGLANDAWGGGSTVAGGIYNLANAWGGGSVKALSAGPLAATVGGGYYNDAIGPYVTVAGGYENRAEAEMPATSQYSLYGGAAIGGGENNDAIGPATTISGGYYNIAGVGPETRTKLNKQLQLTGSVGATVGGGAYNVAEDQLTTVSGGDSNYAEGAYATIGGGHGNDVAWSEPDKGLQAGPTASGTVAGGFENVALGDFASVGGGYNNAAMFEPSSPIGFGLAVPIKGGPTVGGGVQNGAIGFATTVGGGWNNTAGIRPTDAKFSKELQFQGRPLATVGGGGFNRAIGPMTTIGGGLQNAAGIDRATLESKLPAPLITPGGTIAGGIYNNAADTLSTIAGGDSNYVGCIYGAIGGGHQNSADAPSVLPPPLMDGNSRGGATVGGGYKNYAYGMYATIAGGVYNHASDAQWGGPAIGGGFYNYAVGEATTIPGGYSNTAGTSGGLNNQLRSKTLIEAGDPGATVGGGVYNEADAFVATIAGGGYNYAYAESPTEHGITTAGPAYGGPTVGGGLYNDAVGMGTTVAGGFYNMAGANLTVREQLGKTLQVPGAPYATVGGGLSNWATDTFSTIAGGDSNYVECKWGFIGGGHYNYAADWSVPTAQGEDQQFLNDEERALISKYLPAAPAPANYGSSTVGGGFDNNAVGTGATIGGGHFNWAGAYPYTMDRHSQAAPQPASPSATVGGGRFNVAAGGGSTVGGGIMNQALRASTVIAGGNRNVVDANFSAILGGEGNVIMRGANHSYLFGIYDTLSMDSTFMVDMPHIWLGDRYTGYDVPEEIPTYSGFWGLINLGPGDNALHWYDFSAPGPLGAGFAKNVKPLTPADREAVSKKLDDTGSIQTKDALAYLLATVQAQQKRIEELEAKIKSMETSH